MKKITPPRLAALCIVLLAALCWSLPTPTGLAPAAYHTAILFIATILVIVTNIAPTGYIAIISLTLYAVLRAGGEATPKAAIDGALVDFNHPLIWLIVIAFMIASAFAKTGLGKRIALLLLSRFGQSTLRSAYCLAVADFILAPATPSNTARAAIVAPIANSLAKTINKDDRKLGQFLLSSVSAMNDASAVAFSTGFAGNLALVGIAASVAGMAIGFRDWALYLLPPAIGLLLVIPFVLYLVIRPETRDTPDAPRFAREELAKMGPLSRHEKSLLGVFVGLVVLWVGGSTLGLDATTVAFLGLAALLLLGVLNWDDVKGNSAAFDTLIWFSVLMGMADNLKRVGFTGWLGDELSHFMHNMLGGFGTIPMLLVVMGLYLFTSYAFASATAKVVALAPVIAGALLAVGVPKEMVIFSIAAITNVGCNLATYSHARIPLLLGMGYHTSAEWMRIGLVIALVGFVVVMSIGLTWWQFLI
ncbi:MULTISPECIES: DASS family sodium-coupled anion symporter [Aeromonas]|jgi:DASS family divalent anion:Na+ symporter|uniref:DASS family sodium-coupled anion symporter n=1 Tax=Aeromonas popoffii TaxID=70856 RepID=A0ABS5GQM7_9GAMM|nr:MULTISPECIES: DASS family sodium-coupled anion symporter [Aeromonas]MBR7629142.1 DASS family sodium-coupled anion symporter [Aeromonas popoffii]MDF2415619.1 DASS family sodium-coupled anion symporter [Aeromonas sp. 1HA1]PTT55132.1 2-oxoglutarate translocator [Aeromonas sp. HMWF014]